MPRKPDATALLAPNQDLVFEHQFTDVLETDWTLILFQTQTGCDPRNMLALRVCSRYGSAPAFLTIYVKQQQRQRLERVHVFAGFVNDADTVGIAICGEADMTSGFPYRFRQRLQLRHHRFRMDPTKQRVRIPSNRSDGARCISQQLFKYEAAAPVPRVYHDFQLRVGNPVPVEQRLQVIEILR